jgi:hypothetical protein
MDHNTKDCGEFGGGAIRRPQVGLMLDGAPAPIDDESMRGQVPKAWITEIFLGRSRLAMSLHGAKARHSRQYDPEALLRPHFSYFFVS